MIFLNKENKKLLQDISGSTKKSTPSQLEIIVFFKLLEKFGKKYLLKNIRHEFKLVPDRRFRCDFVITNKKLVIEIEGGVYNRGRHVRGSGFEKDCAKYNMISELGYTVYRVTSNMIYSRGIFSVGKKEFENNFDNFLKRVKK